jgi:hypothetical protein
MMSKSFIDYFGIGVCYLVLGFSGDPIEHLEWVLPSKALSFLVTSCTLYFFTISPLFGANCSFYIGI